MAFDLGLLVFDSASLPFLLSTPIAIGRKKMVQYIFNKFHNYHIGLILLPFSGWRRTVLLY
jgi:hypothetical protein